MPLSGQGTIRLDCLGTAAAYADPALRSLDAIHLAAAQITSVLTCTPEFTSCGIPHDFDPEAGTTLVLPQGPSGDLYQLT